MPGDDRSDLRVATQETWVIWSGLFAIGIGFGIVVTSHGLPWWLAPVISTVVFAGSVEFLLVGMLASGAPILAIAVTTLLVNSRHLFYGLSFPLHRVRGWRKAYSIFALTDEAYAITTAKESESLTGGHILWAQLGLHASWATGALVGGLAGATALRGLEGLDFILTAMFVVLAMDAYRARPDTRTLLLAVAAAAVALVFAPGSMLLVAMTLFAAALAARHRLQPARPAGRADSSNLVADPGYTALALTVAVAITFTLRAIPFAMKSALRDSALLADVGRWMPLGAISILAVYCLAGLHLTDPGRAVPQLAGLAVTVAVHLWRRNLVLSLVTGTTVSLLLANWIVPALS